MISIITPAYNNAKQVEKLLESIQPEINKDSSLEVVVVDDASKDDSIKVITNKKNFTKYVRLDKNRGPAAARNKGAGLAKNEILLFLDSDVVLNTETITRIKEKFTKDASLKAFCGEYDIDPVDRNFFTKFKAVLSHSWIPQTPYISAFVARLGAIKKDIFKEVGGFDETIKTAATEEWDLGRKLMNKGIKIEYDHTVTVKHHFPGFLKLMKLLYHRSFMWADIYKKYKQFDNTCTTPYQGITQIIGVSTIISFIISMFNLKLLWLSISLIIAFLFLNKKFFRIALKEEGALFSFLSIVPLLLLSCAIIIGVSLGFIYHFLPFSKK